jgi:hypothetical protein
MFFMAFFQTPRGAESFVFWLMVNRPLRRLRGGAGNVGCVLGRVRRKALAAKNGSLGENPLAGKRAVQHSQHHASRKPFIIPSEGAGRDRIKERLGVL